MTKTRIARVPGSVAGFIDYGPLGSMMKRKIENIWRHFYVVQEGYYEIECPTIGQEDGDLDEETLEVDGEPEGVDGSDPDDEGEDP